MHLTDFRDDDIPLLLSWFDSERAVVQWGGPDLHFPLTQAAVAAMLAEARTTPPGRLLLNGVVDGAVVAHGQVHLDHRHGEVRGEMVRDRNPGVATGPADRCAKRIERRG